MPVEAIIFDMDSVLVDCEVYWQKSRVEFARNLGKQWDSHAKEWVMERNTREGAEAMREYLNLTIPLDAIDGDIHGANLLRPPAVV